MPRHFSSEWNILAQDILFKEGRDVVSLHYCTLWFRERERERERELRGSGVLAWTIIRNDA